MAEPVIYLPGRHRLKEVLGGRDDIYPFLEYNTFDVTKWEDDFQGDQFKYDATSPGTYQSTASGAGSATAALVAGTVNGIARLVTGTDNGGRSDLSLGLHYQGQLNAVIAVRVSFSAVAGAKMEVGFTDVVSGTDAGAVNVLATPSFNADNAVLWCVDTSDTALWQAVGVQATTAATKIEPSSAQVGPAAATYETMIVALNGTSAKFFRLDADGKPTYQSDWMTNAVTAATNLTPWVFAQSRNTTDKNCDIDFIRVWQRRTTG